MKLYYSKDGHLIKWDDLTQLKNGDYLFYNKRFDNDKREIEMSFPNLLSGRNMFCNTSLDSISGDSSGSPANLSNLVDGYRMFYNTNLTSFNGDLSSLVNGYQMFSSTSLTSFSGDLSSLVNGSNMFYSTSLKSFTSDLSSLVDGTGMFCATFHLKSFSVNLSSLVNGYLMFFSSSFTSFNGDLSSLVDGYWMFCGCDNLTSFDGKNLKKLLFADGMFNNCKLSIPSIERIAEQVFDYANMDWDSLPILFNSGQDFPSEEEIQLKDEGLYVYNNTNSNRYQLYCIYRTYNTTDEKFYKKANTTWASYDKSSKTLIQGNEIELDIDEEQAADATNMAKLQAAFDKLAAKGWDVTSNISMTSSILEGDEITKDTSIYAKVETQIDENRSNEYTHIDANGNNVLLRTAKYIGPRLTDWQLFASIEDAEQHFGLRPIK